MNDIQIIHGDCLQVLPELTRNKVNADLIFCDSPYNQDVNYGSQFNDNKSREDFVDWCERWVLECHDNLTHHGSLWVLISHEYAADVEMILRDTGFKVVNWITWYESFGVNCRNKFTRSSRRLFHAVIDPKNYIFNREPVTRPSARQEIYGDKRANPEGRLWDDVWGVNPAIPRLCGTHAERIEGFPTQLPVKLLETIVACASSPEDLIIDPFSGSGTTGVACIELGRRYIGIEINPEYVEKSRERLYRLKQEKEDKCLL